MDERPAARLAARIIALAGVVIAVVGLVLVLGAPTRTPPPDNAADGIGTAFRTIVGGALLVTAGLAGIVAVVLWLLAERRARRLR